MNKRVIAVAIVCAGMIMTMAACSNSGPAPSVATSQAVGVGEPSQEIQDLCLKIVADGMTEAEANEAASAAGFTTRVGSVDGEMMATTRDYRIDRMTFDIQDGVVTGCQVG